MTLSGYVKDNETGEGMIAATVMVKELNAGTVTNEYGFYSITVVPGTYTVEYSFIGFESFIETVDLTSNVTKNAEIGFSQTMLDEVVITGEREDENITSVEMSVEKLDIAQVKKIPQLLGEADIIRSIQLLPGVTTVGEGATGFNVRGGNIDQNLILLDESPVFSSSHLFGFFSVFNADAIKDAKLYKGGIPSKYGGRLSSVLDIRQKEGNQKRFSATGGIGLLFSRLTLEGPIVKNKASFIVSGRRSYFDIFFPFAPDETINNSRLFFYDLNGKVNWTINDKNRVFLAGYLGDDVFDLNGLFATRWEIEQQHFAGITFSQINSFPTLPRSIVTIVMPLVLTKKALDLTGRRALKTSAEKQISHTSQTQIIRLNSGSIIHITISDREAPKLILNPTMLWIHSISR